MVPKEAEPGSVTGWTPIKMELVVLLCIIFSALALLVAIWYRITAMCHAASRKSVDLPQSAIAPGIDQNPIYNPAYNQRALSTGKSCDWPK